MRSWVWGILVGLLALGGSGCENELVFGDTATNPEESPGGDDDPVEDEYDPTDVSGLTLSVSPDFDRTDLTDTEALWYDRLETSIDATWAVVTTLATTADLHDLAYDVGHYTDALLVALRATGDPGMLGRVATLSELYRAALRDAWEDGTTDGYDNWRWLADPLSDDYGTDRRGLEDGLAHAHLAGVAYAFEFNRDRDPDHAERADFWWAYLIGDFLAKWIERAGDDEDFAWDTSAGFYRRFANTRAAQLRLAHHLAAITGRPWYQTRATAIASELMTHVELNPGVTGAYRWKHQISGPDLGWQKIEFAHQLMGPVMEMHIEGFAGYAETSEMTAYMVTFRDAVFGKFGPPYVDMALRVDGSESTPLVVYGLDGLARWDETGTLLEVAERAFTADLTGVSIAANALLAVSRR